MTAFSSSKQLKLSFSLSLAILGGLSIATPVQAQLFSRAGGTMVYDNDRNITWVADANLFKTLAFASGNDTAYVQSVIAANAGTYTLSTNEFNTSFGRMTWNAAGAWVSTLSYGGFSDWRLPSLGVEVSGYNKTSSEMGHLFYTELGGTAFGQIPNTPYFSNEQNHIYWTNTPFSLDNRDAWFFNMNNGEQDHYSGTNLFHAWVVRDGDVAPVHVPGALGLFAMGLLSLFGMKRRAV